MIKLHHIGIVVASIEKFEKSMIFQNKIVTVEDSIQRARIALYTNYSDILIELIEPKDIGSFTWNSLVKNGDHLNHLCYSVGSEVEMNKFVKVHGLLLFKGPIEAIIFEGRFVYFAIDRNRSIVEFVIMN
jgi:hypothetical protein